MTIRPPELTPLLVEFAPAFTRPTYRRSLVLGMLVGHCRISSHLRN